MIGLALIVAGCTDSAIEPPSASSSPTPTVDLDGIPTGDVVDFGPAPVHPDGPWGQDIQNDLQATVAALISGTDARPSVQALGESGDARVAWALTDLQRFVRDPAAITTFETAIAELIGLDLDPIEPWKDAIEHLIAWDLPVPRDDYFEIKRDLYSALDSRWEPLFSDENTIDWRHVTWGGVQIDDRPGGSNDPCRCIPALDDPAVTPAAEGDWYPDDRIVFGLVVGDEARAFPKNIMEVHEMVNDTLGGRRIGMPYCTLCGSAQAYFTDELGDAFPQPVFRTSGLLIRSNKMMYERETQSFVDTFLGRATSGPLGSADVEFTPLSVITTTWGEWKADHPDTTIVAEDGGLGRSYELDPLDGRDDDGPIFPVGSVDPRLPVQEPVLGVIGASGDEIAFHVATVREVLSSGGSVEVDGIELRLDGGGIRAEREDGSDAMGHQAFWFAWSQFRPATRLWPHDYNTSDG